MRLRAGSTANKPVGQIRQIARGDPCGGDQTRWLARPGCACVTGNRAREPGAGCSAGKSACPWPRRSPRSVSLEAFPAIRPLTFGSARLLRDSVEKWSCYWPARFPGHVTPGSQPYRRLSGDCLRVLTQVRWVKLGLRQRDATLSCTQPPPGRNAPQRTLNNAIGMQQNCWQPHGKLLASPNAVSDLERRSTTKHDGGSPSGADDLAQAVSCPKIASRRRR